jgi:hypothetical protein
MQKDIRRRMSNVHEQWLQRLFGGVISPGSGNQFANPGDVKQSHYDNQYAFTFDGKATLAASQSIPLEMWRKIQRQSTNNHPALALRYYLDARLNESVDLIVIDAHIFKELLDVANDRSKR